MDERHHCVDRRPTNGMAARLPRPEATLSLVETRGVASIGMTDESRAAAQSVPLRPRILYVIGQLGVGGYERQLYNLLQALDRPSYRPMVVVWGATRVQSYVSKIRSLGIAVHSFPDHLSRAAKFLAFRRLVKELSPELVHSYSFYTNFLAWYATLGTTSIAVCTRQVELPRRSATS